MSDLQAVRGFEEALRPPVDIRRARITPTTLQAPGRADAAAVIARVARVARRTPEVMVKITGRTRDGGHLGRHLDYISRNGAVALEGPDGERLEGRDEVRALAQAWRHELAMEPGRRGDAPVSLSIVLSMPAGTEAFRLHDAARAFAADVFGDRFPYVFALHDEGRHPHVHLTVRMTGRDGERLNPRKADLQVWREAFAFRLRERAVEAEATPRRTRGVVRRAERAPMRRMRERFAAGKGEAPRRLGEAVRSALAGHGEPEPWRDAIVDRQRHIRRALLSGAMRLAESGAEADREVGAALDRFVRERPPVETRSEAIRRSADRSRPGPEQKR